MDLVARTLPVLALLACTGPADPSDGETGPTGTTDGNPTTEPEKRVYAGGWDVGDCWNDIVPTGTDTGDVMPDFALVDQFGDTVHLHDFCHKTIFLTTGAFW